jgi:hypothetical protein
VTVPQIAPKKRRGRPAQASLVAAYDGQDCIGTARVGVRVILVPYPLVKRPSNGVLVLRAADNDADSPCQSTTTMPVSIRRRQKFPPQSAARACASPSVVSALRFAALHNLNAPSSVASGWSGRAFPLTPRVICALDR